MTGKRFQKVIEELDWGSIFYYTDNNTKLSDEETLNLLNELHEENKKLKKHIQAIEKAKDDFHDKVFQCINRRIKVYQHKPFSAPISNPANPNYDNDVDRLARLSELEQLQEEFTR